MENTNTTPIPFTIIEGNITALKIGSEIIDTPPFPFGSLGGLSKDITDFLEAKANSTAMETEYKEFEKIYLSMGRRLVETHTLFEEAKRRFETALVRASKGNGNGNGNGQETIEASSKQETGMRKEMNAALQDIEASSKQETGMRKEMNAALQDINEKTRVVFAEAQATLDNARAEAGIKKPDTDIGAIPSHPAPPPEAAKTGIAGALAMIQDEANRHGDSSTLIKAVDDAREEQTARAIAEANGGGVPELPARKIVSEPQWVDVEDWLKKNASGVIIALKNLPEFSAKDVTTELKQRGIPDPQLDEMSAAIINRIEQSGQGLPEGSEEQVNERIFEKVLSRVGAVFTDDQLTAAIRECGIDESNVEHIAQMILQRVHKKEEKAGVLEIVKGKVSDAKDTVKKTLNSRSRSKPPEKKKK